MSEAAPPARELLLHWSSAWDAPRFRGDGCVHHPALDRVAVQPLLNLAASCFAEVRRVTDERGEHTECHPFGASRELLVAALDGRPEGIELCEPMETPQQFVRALVHAAYQTGDGTYVPHMDGGKLDSLIDEHCAKQLEEAVQIAENPNLLLQQALATATKSVDDVLAVPQENRGFDGTAKRALLVKQLKRFASDAAALVETESSSVEVAPSVPEPVLEGDEAAVEDDEPLVRTVQRTKSGTESEGLQRTKSQAIASIEVQRVANHLDEHRQPIRELRQAATSLKEQSLEQQDLHATLQAVLSAQKRARNFGEDLLDDMLALDRVPNLTPEDRSQRKKAILGIEGLLDDVDGAKSVLASLQKDIEKKIEEANAKAKAAVREQDPPPVVDGNRQRDLAQEALRVAAAVPPPEVDVWEQVRLPIRFHTQEQANQYVILATVSGLSIDHLKLKLGEDDRSLRVEGLKLPGLEENMQMQRRITSRLQQLARTHPERFEDFRDVKKIAQDAYVKLGQGEFGLFSEVFRVPSDVDVEGIDASYKDGVLKIVLPKVVRNSHETFGTMPQFGSFRNRHAELPFGARRSPHLFGGLGDDFW